MGIRPGVSRPHPGAPAAPPNAAAAAAPRSPSRASAAAVALAALAIAAIVWGPLSCQGRLGSAAGLHVTGHWASTSQHPLAQVGGRRAQRSNRGARAWLRLLRLTTTHHVEPAAGFQPWQLGVCRLPGLWLRFQC